MTIVIQDLFEVMRFQETFLMLLSLSLSLTPSPPFACRTTLDVLQESESHVLTGNRLEGIEGEMSYLVVSLGRSLKCRIVIIKLAEQRILVSVLRRMS